MGGRWLKPKLGSVVSAYRKISGILAAGSGAGKHSILRCWHENSILRYDYENPILGNDWTQFWGQCKKPILGCSIWAGGEVFARNGVNLCSSLSPQLGKLANPQIADNLKFESFPTAGETRKTLTWSKMTGFKQSFPQMMRIGGKVIPVIRKNRQWTHRKPIEGGKMKRVDNYTIGTAKARSGDVVKSWGCQARFPRHYARGGNWNTSKHDSLQYILGSRAAFPTSWERISCPTVSEGQRYSVGGR